MKTQEKIWTATIFRWPYDGDYDVKLFDVMAGDGHDHGGFALRCPIDGRLLRIRRSLYFNPDDHLAEMAGMHKRCAGCDSVWTFRAFGSD